MTSLVRSVALVVLLPVLLAGRAAAAGLDVSPVLLELGAGERATLLRLRNDGESPSRYQITVHSWSEKREGGMDLGPTDEVVVFPPVLELAPGATRNVRVGVTAGPGVNERAWRLFVEELPPPPTPGNQVRILTRIGIPVFLAPARVVERAVIEDVAAPGARLEFTLRNEGTVRIRPTAVQVVGRKADGAVLFEVPGEAWYVLAGGERRYALDLPAARCAAATVTIRVVLPSRTLESAVAPAVRGCGP